MRRLPAYLYVADLVPGKRVLEVPCGDADGAAFLASCGAASALAVDGSREHIERARRRHRLANLELRCEDPARLELEDGSIDMVFVPDAAGLVRRREALDELRRVLAPDGWLIACAASADRPAGSGGLTYHEIGERLQPLFAPVRVAAQSPFIGVTLCEYAAGDSAPPSVELDRTLVDPARAAEVTGYVAICGGRPGPARGLSLVELPPVDAREVIGELAAPPPAPVPARPAAKTAVAIPISEQIAAALAEHARQAADREAALAEAREWAEELRDELERERLRLAATEERAMVSGEVADELRRQLAAARGRLAVAEGELLRLRSGGDVDLAAELAEARRKLDRATDNWKQAEAKNDEVWRRVGELQTELGQLREQTMESARRQRQQSQVDLARALEKSSVDLLSAQERQARAEREVAELRERLRRAQESSAPAEVRGAVARLEQELAGARAVVDELAAAVAELSQLAATGGGPERSLALELGVREAELAFLTIGLSSLQARVREAAGQVRDARQAMHGRSPEEMLAMITRLEETLRGLA